MGKLNQQLLDYWGMVPPGFSPERALDLTRTLNAREFHYRHPDGRLHVLRFRNRSHEKLLDITVPPKPELPPWSLEELMETFETRHKNHESSSPAKAVRRNVTSMGLVIPGKPPALEGQAEEKTECHEQGTRHE